MVSAVCMGRYITSCAVLSRCIYSYTPCFARSRTRPTDFSRRGQSLEEGIVMLTRTWGSRPSTEITAYHQTVSVLFLANDRCLQDYDLVVAHCGQRAVMLCDWGVKADMVLFAGNTVWSISARIRGVCVDALYKSTFTLIIVLGPSWTPCLPPAKSRPVPWRQESKYNVG